MCSVRLFLYTNVEAYSLKSTPNDRFFLETFHGNFYLSTDFLLEICSEEVDGEIIFAYFIFLELRELEIEPWPHAQ